MASFIDRVKLGITAFREAYLTSHILDIEDWNSQDARGLRYAILWAMYEQTSYRNVHMWATAYRKQYALYKYIRPIYNPAYRLGEFWKAHIFGGLLDKKAGEIGAIPIVTENEALRPAIAELWKWSKWNVKKDVLTTKGSMFGDIAIQVVDDVSRGRVYLDLMNPGIIQFIDKDPFGNIKGYTLRENRTDPRSSTGTVTYTEVVSRDGVNVVYQTFLNGELYAWPENVTRTGEAVSTWSEPYGFIPLVVIQHNDVGLEWGWSELHPVRAKTQEADDISSQVSDQIRKTIDPVWLMKGIKEPKTGSIVLSGASTTADSDRPAPGREELQAIWNVPKDGGAEAMVPNLDIGAVLTHLDSILKEIERDIPELAADIHTSSGDASGRALRVARQPVASKVLQRRTNYDSVLVSAHQMAIAIGGWRGYNEYASFNLDSYIRGDLDHSIAERPVFDEDPLDTIEVDAAFWSAAAIAQSAGLSLEGYLKEAGWSEERIAELGIQEVEEETEETEEEEQDNDETD